MSRLIILKTSVPLISFALVLWLRRLRSQRRKPIADYIRAMRIIGLNSPLYNARLPELRDHPKAVDPENTVLFDGPVELIPGKDLDTRPTGEDWYSDYERIVTPTSLDDLGDWKVGNALALMPLLADRAHCILPYHISVAHRALVLVQHEAGYHPTSASFMFVGQRRRTKLIVGLSWERAAQLAESLPEAHDLGPVLFVQMTARCGSTVLIKALERLDVGCQSVSEPEFLGDVHEMLDRGECSRAEAISILRATLLLMVHRLRLENPNKPLIVIKPRSMTGLWRHCELLPEALPGAQQIVQWRRIDNVVASMDAGVSSAMGMLSATLHDYSLDGLLWPGSIHRFMRHLTDTLKTDPLLKLNCDAAVNLSVAAFSSKGCLGFQALNCIFCWHTMVALAGRGLWTTTISYEYLMRHKSAAVKELLSELGYLHLAKDVARLGSVEADAVFYADAHGDGGWKKKGGSTLGGSAAVCNATAVLPRPLGALDERLKTDHVPPGHADTIHCLLKLHPMLYHQQYDIAALVHAKPSVATVRAARATTKSAGTPKAKVTRPSQDKVRSNGLPLQARVHRYPNAG